MKRRMGFVSNSSSSSFIIINTSLQEKTLVDFVEENPLIIEDWRETYSYDEANGHNQEALIENARMEDIIFKAGEEKECVFGDESGTLIGQVFDYMLRDGGESESFKWRFHEALR